MTQEICSIVHGRSHHTYDLLDEVQQYIPDGRQAHAEIHALLADLVAVDGEDAVILARRPVDPGLLDANPQDLDVLWWWTISDDTARTIREVIAAQHA